MFYVDKIQYQCQNYGVVFEYILEEVGIYVNIKRCFFLENDFEIVYLKR